MIIAVDGVTGSGKSTVSKIVAEKINFNYLYSGGIYRAIALKFASLNFKKVNLANIKKTLECTKIKLKLKDFKQEIYLDGKKLDLAIYSQEISTLASIISEFKIVHEFVHEIERGYAKGKNIIVEGREIGSALFPNAEVKFFLTASVAARAKRRQEQFLRKGEKISLAKTKKQIQERDFRDFNRKDFPLVKLPDAIEINCSNLTVEQVVDIILDEIKKRMK